MIRYGQVRDVIVPTRAVCIAAPIATNVNANTKAFVVFSSMVIPVMVVDVRLIQNGQVRYATNAIHKIKTSLLICVLARASIHRRINILAPSVILYVLPAALPPTTCVGKFLPVVAFVMHVMGMESVPLTVNVIVTKGGLIRLAANSALYRVQTWVLTATLIQAFVNQ